MHDSGFARDHYVPVLKWKKGEYSALRELGQAEYDGITPLIEIPDTPETFDEDTPTKTLQQYLKPIPDQLASSVGRHRAFLDIGAIEEEVVDDKHPLEWLHEQCKESIPGLIPRYLDWAKCATPGSGQEIFYGCLRATGHRRSQRRRGCSANVGTAWIAGT